MASLCTGQPAWRATMPEPIPSPWALLPFRLTNSVARHGCPPLAPLIIAVALATEHHPAPPAVRCPAISKEGHPLRSAQTKKATKMRSGKSQVP